MYPIFTKNGKIESMEDQMDQVICEEQMDYEVAQLVYSMFKSGNEIEVERITITRKHINDIINKIKEKTCE